ncbi:hypothetical protein [Paraburkholderia tropica]|uniref:hypothetical protein n=1 Tax=Paraburkholderia tropica TaxID=92647 RepID=UPI001E5FE19C|nr:hypothetical protein [Paraburkholderia tropica]
MYYNVNIVRGSNAMRTARFHTAVTPLRPHGSHRFDVFGPKIGRRLTLFGREALQLWLRMEADPQVVSYCERPMRISVRSRPADFWVETNVGEHLYLVARLPPGPSAGQGVCPCPALEAWGRARSIALRIISPDDLNDSEMLCQNRLTMLQYVAARPLATVAEFRTTILSACESGLSLAVLERQFEQIDQAVVRTTAFSLILQDRLACPTIASQSLGPRSQLVKR